MRGVAHSDQMRVVERITPLDKDTLKYEVTVEDPKIYSKPWTVMLPLNRDESYLLLEYGCHEGNMSLRNELPAGRAAAAPRPLEPINLVEEVPEALDLAPESTTGPAPRVPAAHGSRCRQRRRLG